MKFDSFPDAPTCESRARNETKRIDSETKRIESTRLGNETNGGNERRSRRRDRFRFIEWIVGIPTRIGVDSLSSEDSSDDATTDDARDGGSDGDG